MSIPSNAAQRDIETLIHPYTNLAEFRETGPIVFSKGSGIHVYDDQGKEYIEGMSGLWCASLGFDEPALMEAAVTQMKALPYYHQFSGKSQEPGIELAERLKEMAPVPISKVLFSTSGSEANDTQIKLVWYYNNARGKPKKKKIISRIKAYHGVTIATASLTGLPPLHQDFDLPIPGILHTDCPHHYRFAEPGETESEFTDRLAKNLEELIIREDPETVAAFIAEPVMGAGGVIIPPRDYFLKIQPVLEKYDIVFIADEVICGFGRTGNMFGTQTFSMKPHSLSVAKALTGAYLPMSAVLIPEFIYEAMLEESRKIGTFGHGFTWGGHPVCAAVANRALDLYQERQIVPHVQSVRPTLTARFAALEDHPLVGEAKSVGLLGAIELVSDKATKKSFEAGQMVGAACARFAQEEGLIVRNLPSDRIAFCPPLIMTDGDITEMMDRFQRALDQTEAWVTKEGLRTA